MWAQCHPPSLHALQPESAARAHGKKAWPFLFPFLGLQSPYSSSRGGTSHMKHSLGKSAVSRTGMWSRWFSALAWPVSLSAFRQKHLARLIPHADIESMAKTPRNSDDSQRRPCFHQGNQGSQAAVLPALHKAFVIVCFWAQAVRDYAIGRTHLQLLLLLLLLLLFELVGEYGSITYPHTSDLSP